VNHRAGGDAAERPIRVLVVCTGNSARSLMAEALLRHHGGDAFEVHSAGTEPKGINPLTERVLDEAGIDHAWARSKSVTEFLGQQFDYVITVCDQARQVCPVFPGVHETLHWGYDDPAAVEGTDDERVAAFRSTLTMMATRIQGFIILARKERIAAGAS
jgi:arsenate reductase